MMMAEEFLFRIYDLRFEILVNGLLLRPYFSRWDTSLAILALVP
jgi:hypothetical protein